jgi:hypothetical protein
LQHGAREFVAKPRKFKGTGKIERFATRRREVGNQGKVEDFAQSIN